MSCVFSLEERALAEKKVRQIVAAEAKRIEAELFEKVPEEILRLLWGGYRMYYRCDIQRCPQHKQHKHAS